MSNYRFTAQDARDIVIKHQGESISRGFINDCIIKASKEQKTEIVIGVKPSTDVIASLNSDGFIIKESKGNFTISWNDSKN